MKCRFSERKNRISHKHIKYKNKVHDSEAVIKLLTTTSEAGKWEDVGVSWSSQLQARSSADISKQCRYRIDGRLELKFILSILLLVRLAELDPYRYIGSSQAWLVLVSKSFRRNVYQKLMPYPIVCICDLKGKVCLQRESNLCTSRLNRYPIIVPDPKIISRWCLSDLHRAVHAARTRDGRGEYPCHTMFFERRNQLHAYTA